MNAMWQHVHPGFDMRPIQADSVLRSLYNDAAARLPECDFVHTDGAEPRISVRDSPVPTRYEVAWDTAAALGWDSDRFSGAIIHELAHAAVHEMYDRNGLNDPAVIMANLHLPPGFGPPDPRSGFPASHLPRK
jgi:hypothetical protein